MSERSALLTLRLAAPAQARVETALREAGFAILQPQTAADWEAALARAEIAWLRGDADARLLGRRQLRWIHCGHAGVERFLPLSLFEQGATITCAAGRSAPALAEHAIYLMMALAYDQPGLDRYRRWRMFQAPPPARRRALHARTLGILGLGHSGRLLADYASALGMRVYAYRRRDGAGPASVLRVWSADRGERVDDMLAECEFLVVACGLNAGSRGLLGATQLRALPRGAFVVNIGRGAVVDEDALIAALRSGHLAGAGLDTYTREPLPPTHPFWRMSQVLLSPHRPPRLADRDDRHARQLLANLGRYLRGEALADALGREDAIDPASFPGPRRGLVDRAWNLIARLCGPR